MLLPVSRMYEMSGSRFLFSGVGTQMMTASTSRIRLKSLVAEKVPARTASATAFGGDVLDVALALVERVHLGRIHIQSQHRYTRAGELKGQRQPHVAEPNYCCFHCLLFLALNCLDRIVGGGHYPFGLI